jgi:DNA-binding LytR/AlgR family response regulator
MGREWKSRRVHAMMDRTAATGGGVVATRSLASIMSRPRAIIAEDEPLLRDELAELVGSLWPELEIVARTGDGVATLQALEQHVPDVLFLDIRMPGLTGLDVARQVDRRSHVVFVTAYDQHAIAAFEQGAADFVLKPVTAARLATTVARLKERIGRPAAPIDGILRELTAPKSNYLRWINASQGEAVRIITVDDVNYFEADSKYTRVVTAGEESLIRKPIKELADELDPGCFWQIHRSTIVNVNAIAGVRRDMRGRPQVRLKHRPELLAVSEAYAYLFRQM